jgi:hypothetical protein
VQVSCRYPLEGECGLLDVVKANHCDREIRRLGD